VNRARSFIFDTGIPASVAAGAYAALRIALREPERRERLRSLSRRLRAGLSGMGFQVPDGETPVIPVRLGDSATTMRWMEALAARGCYVPGVRPPTVPAGEGRLRISLMATHTDGHLDRLLDSMKAVRGAAA
jgi:7-keto-8-aminopelargonate synthetase-like enzyme